MEQLLEYLGVLSGLVYLLLEIRQHRAMWVVGFLTSLVYVFVFFFSKFYADMGLNIYYVAISIYGFRKWRISKEAAETVADNRIVFKHLEWRIGVGCAAMTAVLWAVLYYILANHTDSPIPLGDAFTTALSITATWMLAQRIVEHWWIWVVINLVSVALYYQRELYPTCFLFVCYGILAIVGWINWKRKGVVYGG